MAFKFVKNLNGSEPQREEGVSGGTILAGELLMKSSTSVIRCTAATDNPLFVAENDAASGGKVVMLPVLPGFVFQVPTEGTDYVDATHKYTAVDAYDGGDMIDSIQPGAVTYKAWMILGMAEGETAGTGTEVYVTPMFPFANSDLLS